MEQTGNWGERRSNGGGVGRHEYKGAGEEKGSLTSLSSLTAPLPLRHRFSSCPSFPSTPRCAPGSPWMCSHQSGLVGVREIECNMSVWLSRVGWHVKTCILAFWRLGGVSLENWLFHHLSHTLSYNAASVHFIELAWVWKAVVDKIGWLAFSACIADGSIPNEQQGSLIKTLKIPAVSIVGRLQYSTSLYTWFASF